MSTTCPLCGKSKTDESLFCSACTDKLNSEYEVGVPASDTSKGSAEADSECYSAHSTQADSDLNTGANSKQKQKKDQPAQSKVESRSKAVPAPSFDKRAWKRQRDDKRSASNKSYYELEKEKKSHKTIGITVLIIILIAALAGGIYIYNHNVKSDNLERAQWEMAQREHTIDSYLAYMSKFPQGAYADEASNAIYELKNKETAAFEHLKTSDNTSEFISFLEKYPTSPYQRMVRVKLDSLMWQSYLKLNSLEAYQEYINKSNSEELLGNYIGEAKKRVNMLQQVAPIDGGDLERIKLTVEAFFTAISTQSQTTLKEHLAPVVVRFNNHINQESNTVITQLMQQVSEAHATAMQIEPQTDQLQYEQQFNGGYEVNVPLQKVFEGRDDGTTQIKGYIIHLKLSPEFKIYSYHETKPYAEAP